MASKASETDVLWDALGLDEVAEEALFGRASTFDFKEIDLALGDPIVVEALESARRAVDQPGGSIWDVPDGVQDIGDDTDKVDSVLAAAVAGIERQLREAEAQSVTEFVAKGPDIAELNDGMLECDKTLGGVESVLSSLSAKLSGLSGDIRRLENDAVTAAGEVEHRKAAEAHLSAFVDEIVVPPETVRHLVDGTVGQPEYEDHLRVLAKKVAFMGLSDTRRSRAYDEVRPIVRKLLTKAVEKVREYLVEKISLLRRPNTNVEIIKESVLQKHKYLFEFLHDYAPEGFKEVRTGYVATMSRLYLSLFRRYVFGLRSLVEEPLAPGGGLLASLEPANQAGALEGLFAAMGAPLKSPGEAVAPVARIFALGDRIDSLRQAGDPSIVLAVAVSNKQKIRYEAFHRSVGKMLLETCTAEHVFCAELFGEVPGRMFDDIFRGVVDFMLEEVIRAHISRTNDSIGVLLAMKINEAHREEMQSRRIGDLGDYFVKADIFLKPKFKEIFDANVRSVSSADINLLFKVRGSNPHSRSGALKLFPSGSFDHRSPRHC